jgi:hypothetical protein
MIQNAPVNIADLDEWIEKNFFGHSRAIRKQDDPPLPDEPYMSMRDAKSLVRKAFAHFTGLH